MAKKIIDGGLGEYLAGYIADDKTVWGMFWISGGPKFAQVPGIANAAGITGGQYSFLVWNEAGEAFQVWKSSGGLPSVTKYTIPGGVVNGCMLNTAAFLINPEGDVYYVGTSTAYDIMKANATNKATLFLSGKQVVKIVTGEDIIGAMYLTKSGEVYIFKPSAKTPVKIDVPKAVDIALVGRGAYVVVTASNDILTWGPQSIYLGVSSASKPVSILSKMPGVKFPLKQIIANWNVLHIIDADNWRWSGGENIMGEIGNGKGNPRWKDSKEWQTNKPTPFAWNWLKGLQIEPMQRLGKWKRIMTSGTMTLYAAGIDLLDNFYTWGRNKTFALMNGDYLNDADNSGYPNALSVYTPQKLDPWSVTWKMKYAKFDPATAPNDYSAPYVDPPVPEVPKFKNVEYTKDFTRNNCGENFKGETLTYRVPAGQYEAATQAEADALAIKEAETSGQALANEIGICTPIRTVTAIITVYSDGTVKTEER